MPRHSTTSRLTAPERLREEVNAQVAQERRQALRALLMRPLLPAGGETADTYRLVRRHQEHLATWFAHWPGWTLRVQPGLARLEKTSSSDDDATRGAIDPINRTPLTRRRYALFCLTMSVLCGEDRQTTLRQVAERVEATAATSARLAATGFELDLRTQPHRRDLVCVMRLLNELQILTRLDGDDSLYLRGDGDCLYRVDHAVLGAALSVARGPSTVDEDSLDDRMEAMQASARPEGEEPRSRELQYRLVRRMLDDSVVYQDDLNEHEIEYLRFQRVRLVGEVEEATGLAAEVRQEGIALLDADGDLSDFRLPEQGTRGHAVLLVAEWLAEKRRDGSSGTVTIDELRQHLTDLATEHESHWRKNVSGEDGVQLLTDDVVRVLESLRLILVRGHRIQPLPAIARYRLAEPEPVSKLRQQSLL
ncbi:MAG: TIGR02678 family protein [Planctomycetaceae bacterium]